MDVLRKESSNDIEADLFLHYRSNNRSKSFSYIHKRYSELKDLYSKESQSCHLDDGMPLYALALEMCIFLSLKMRKFDEFHKFINEFRHIGLDEIRHIEMVEQIVMASSSENIDVILNSQSPKRDNVYLNIMLETLPNYENMDPLYNPIDGLYGEAIFTYNIVRMCLGKTKLETLSKAFKDKQFFTKEEHLLLKRLNRMGFMDKNEISSDLMIHLLAIEAIEIQDEMLILSPGGFFLLGYLNSR